MIKQYLQKRQEIVPAISRTNQITNGIRHCFATGNWGVQKPRIYDRCVSSCK